MRIPLAKRVVVTVFNIVFPPLAVAVLTGPTSRDTLVNCLLFLLAVIPAHVHGFYVAAVYFTRKRRVRKGRWPGKGRKWGVWSEKVLTGGVGWEGAEELRGRNGKERRGKSTSVRSDSLQDPVPEAQRVSTGGGSRVSRLSRRSLKSENV